MGPMELVRVSCCTEYISVLLQDKILSIHGLSIFEYKFDVWPSPLPGLSAKKRGSLYMNGGTGLP